MRKTVGVLGAGFSALFLAVCSISCCVAPLIFVLFGVSFSFLSFLETLNPFRYLFAALSLGFIAYGYWKIYLSKRPFCTGGALSQRTAKLLFWGLAALAMFVLAYPAIDGFIFEVDE